jgi:SAM-dependent methyltransferase
MTEVRVRPDVELLKASSRERRSNERLRAHYELELELAARLLGASRADRPKVYGEVYSELFARLPDHPQHHAGRHQSDRIASEFKRVRPFIRDGQFFLEIGCGDAALAFHAAPQVGRSFGMDVTEALIPKERPPNFQFLRTDGVNIPLDTGSIELAYSNQLMEHLHPDDAQAQLREIARVLAPGGRYYCSTPSRASGPHDISRYFDYEARGFHLKEYDYAELTRLFRSVGFSKVEVLLGSRPYRIPCSAARGFENLMLALPKELRARLTCSYRVSQLLGIQILGTK